MSSKIGRNDKCYCGSNKKYKKCCMLVTNKPIEEATFKDSETLVEKIKDVIDKRNTISPFKGNFKLKNKIPTVRRLEKMPNHIYKKVTEMVKRGRFKQRMCWYNASHIALNIEGVKKVDGWYGLKIKHLGEDEVTTYYQRNKNKKWIHSKLRPISERVWMINDETHKADGGFIVDYKNKVSYIRHSWNSYNGIHFDVSGQFSDRSQLFWEKTKDYDDIYKDYRWLEYVEYGVDDSDIFSSENSEITQSIVRSMLDKEIDKIMIGGY
jgi:hypothetical protein